MATQQPEWLELVQAASANVKGARLLGADWPPGTLEAADADLDAALGPMRLQFVAPLANGDGIDIVYGITKWLPGSLGCDLFVQRETPVLAPADCIVEEVLLGTGAGCGDKLILSLENRSWAWRYRHTQATVQLQQQVQHGQQVGVVCDPSLDALGNVPAWAGPMPDGWQHLDLSVNLGTDQFNPQGGGGGNIRAFTWLASLRFEGRLLQRTPGPTDVGYGFMQAITFLTPRGRRSRARRQRRAGVSAKARARRRVHA
jgi:hypothetical protein